MQKGEEEHGVPKAAMTGPHRKRNVPRRVAAPTIGLGLGDRFTRN